jgi:hypothetical protein
MWRELPMLTLLRNKNFFDTITYISLCQIINKIWRLHFEKNKKTKYFKIFQNIPQFPFTIFIFWGGHWEFFFFESFGISKK